MIDLLPCPFCGAVPVFVDRGMNVNICHEPEDRSWDVQCGTVGCYAEFGADNWVTQEEVAEAWNKRTSSKVDDA